MKSSISANSTISWKRRSISRRDIPSITPLMNTFSRPLISGWKPAPSSIRADTRPPTRTWPLVGLVMPATSFSRVLFPEPLRPMMPQVVPASTVNDTSSKARNDSLGLRCRTRLPVSSALFRVANRRSYPYLRYTFETCSSVIADDT